MIPIPDLLGVEEHRRRAAEVAFARVILLLRRGLGQQLGLALVGRLARGFALHVLLAHALQLLAQLHQDLVNLLIHLLQAQLPALPRVVDARHELQVNLVLGQIRRLDLFVRD